MRVFKNLNLVPVFVLFVSASEVLDASSVTLSPIYVSIGPNAITPSPSYAGYTASAQAGVAGGGVNVGGSITTTPTAYNVVGSGGKATVSTTSIIGTLFPSWLNTTPPALPSLNGETGNNLYWSVLISGGQGNGNDISLANVNVQQNSSDPNNLFGYQASYSNATYAPDVVGVLSGGGLVTSGPSSQMVNSIIVTDLSADLDSSTFSFLTGTSLSGTNGQQLQQMDAAFAQYLGNFAIDTCFYYGSASSANPNSCDSVNVVSSAPEPVPVRGITFAFCLLVAGKLIRRSSQSDAS